MFFVFKHSYLFIILLNIIYVLLFSTTTIKIKSNIHINVAV